MNSRDSRVLCFTVLGEVKPTPHQRHSSIHSFNQSILHSYTALPQFFADRPQSKKENPEAPCATCILICPFMKHSQKCKYIPFCGSCVHDGIDDMLSFQPSNVPAYIPMVICAWRHLAHIYGLYTLTILPKYMLVDLIAPGHVREHRLHSSEVHIRFNHVYSEWSKILHIWRVQPL